MKTLTRAVAAAAFAGLAVLTTSPIAAPMNLHFSPGAEVQDAGWRGWHGGRHGGWHGGWGGGWGGWGGFGGWGFAPFAGLLGFGLGAAIARDRYYDYGPGYYGGYAPEEPYGGGHVERCLSAYRSYNPETDTFLGYDGYYHYCRL